MLFPAEVLPIVSVLANMVHFFLGLPILVGVPDLLSATARLPPSSLWFPVVVLVQLVFTLGLALILSALTVHFRDIRDILANLLTFWFFATPIIYPYGSAERPAVPHGCFNLNPFTHLAVSYQEILFFHGPVRPLEVAARARRGVGRALPGRLLAVRSAARLVRGGGVS